MSTFVAEINKLKGIQQNLERNDNILVEQISRMDDSLQISDFFKDNTSSRAAQVEKLQTDVKCIVVPLRKVNNLIRQENIGHIDLKSVKKEMVTIQNNLLNLKDNTKNSLQLLKKEEEKLLEDMELIDKKVQEYNKTTINIPKKYVAKKTSLAPPENISPEVKEFMEFVAASGGHVNGWAVDDHNLFLKARGKTKDVEKLAEILHALLPDISEEEIIAHDKWYQKYIDLKEKQKNAIKDWRNNKIKTNKNTVPKNKSPTENKTEQNLLKSFSEYLTKEVRQQKLLAWKAEKRAQMIKQREQKVQEKLRKKELEKQQQEKHKQLKVEVSNWRHSKIAAQEAEKKKKTESEHREREHKAVKANKLIKQFQSQDEILIQRKMQLRQLRPKTAEVEVVKIKHEAPRDPERLFKPTKQWILRSYGGDNSGTTDNKLSLQAIPKLGIPEWRKNVL